MLETLKCDDAKRLIFGCFVASLVVGTSFGQYGVRPAGGSVSQLAPAGTKAVALFFVASDCPVSDRTFPEMKRVREEFRVRDVAVWFVYPNSTEQAVEVVKHQQEFDPGGDALLDPHGDLVRLSGAKVTPEVSVLVPTGGSRWKPAYTGRIDDRFVHLGVERQVVTEHFAEKALAAALDGKAMPKATGPPIGCGIVAGGRR